MNKHLLASTALIASAALLTAAALFFAPAALAQTPAANEARITASATDIAENRAAIAENAAAISENRVAIEELRGDMRVLMAQVEAVDEKIDTNTQFIMDRMQIMQESMLAEMRAEMRAMEIRLQRTLGLLFLAAFAIYPIYIAFLRWALPKMMPKSFGPGAVGMALGVMLALFLGAAALFFAPAVLAQTPAVNEARITANADDIAAVERRTDKVEADIAEIKGDMRVLMAQFEAINEKIDINTQFILAEMRAEMRAMEIRLQRTLGMLFLAAFAIYPIYIAFLRWVLPKMMPKSFGPGSVGMALTLILALFLGAAALFFAPAALVA